MRDAPVVPPKLRPGDEIRVIAPSRSLAIFPDERHRMAERRWNEQGLSVSFGKRVREIDEFKSSSVASRVADFHEAFADPAVRGVLTVIGGFNCHQMLRSIDWDVIARNPKVFCGYSDITALQNAMLAKAGVVSYSGPHFSTYSMLKGLEYDVAGFRRCCMEEGPFDVEPSPTWADDRWWQAPVEDDMNRLGPASPRVAALRTGSLDQENRTFIPNEGPTTIRAGVAEGVIVGGNLCTLNLLHGTEYMPSLEGALLFVEDDAQAGETDVGPETFDRDLLSVLHLPDAAGLAGVVIGRFQRKSKVTADVVRAIVESKPELASIPVACGFDFGHTTPHFTFPVGGRARLDCSGAAPRLTMVVH